LRGEDVTNGVRGKRRKVKNAMRARNVYVMYMCIGMYIIRACIFVIIQGERGKAKRYVKCNTVDDDRYHYIMLLSSRAAVRLSDFNTHYHQYNSELALSVAVIMFPKCLNTIMQSLRTPEPCEFDDFA